MADYVVVNTHQMLAMIPSTFWIERVSMVSKPDIKDSSVYLSLLYKYVCIMFGSSHCVLRFLESWPATSDHYSNNNNNKNRG